MKFAPAMETPSEVVWFFSSEGAAKLPDWTTVELHKMLNIDLRKTLTTIKSDLEDYIIPLFASCHIILFYHTQGLYSLKLIKFYDFTRTFPGLGNVFGDLK